MGGDRESKWSRLRARLLAAAPWLASQGGLARKRVGASDVWRVRYSERGAGGRAVRRAVHVGSDPELVRRAQALLGRLRQQGEAEEESAALARMALRLCSGLARRLRRADTGARG